MAERTRLRAQLGTELRGARTLSGLTQRALAQTIGTSQATVVRVEAGEVLLSRATTLKWLAACDSAGDANARILALTESAHNETRPWSDSLDREVTHLQGIAQARERNARRVRTYLTSMVPGLLQTAEYARLLLPQADPTNSMDHAAALAARIDRQQILFEPGRTFEFLLEEAALRWAPGPGVMAAQRDRLLTVATLESVELAVLPSARVGALGWHSYTVWDPADDGPTYVTTELVHGGQHMSDLDAVKAYETLWDQLWGSALRGDAALTAIRETVG